MMELGGKPEMDEARKSLKEPAGRQEVRLILRRPKHHLNPPLNSSPFDKNGTIERHKVKVWHFVSATSKTKTATAND